MGRSLLGFLLLVVLDCGGKSVAEGGGPSIELDQPLHGRLATYGDAGVGIAIYPPAVTPSTAPLTTIEGAWHRDACQSLAFDRAGNVYALCYQAGLSEPPGQVNVFAPEATADSAPMRVITGSNTGLDGFQANMAVAADGTAYTVRDGGDDESAACGGGSVRVFAPGANGNVAPVRVIEGPHTEFACPAAIAVNAAGEIYVGNAEGGPLLVFAADASGDAAPIRRIGALNDIGDATSIALDAAGSIYVTDAGHRPAVVVYGAAATEGSAPEHVITGAATTLMVPSGIAVDDGGRILVSDSGSFSHEQIAIFAAGADGNATPQIIPNLAGGGIAISP